MTGRTWARFARKKRNLFGVGLALALALLAIFADFVASSRPILLRKGGRLYVFANVIDYRDLRSFVPGTFFGRLHHAGILENRRQVTCCHLWHRATNRMWSQQMSLR